MFHSSMEFPNFSTLSSNEFNGILLNHLLLVLGGVHSSLVHIFLHVTRYD